jgi:hypothetical protein
MSCGRPGACLLLPDTECLAFIHRLGEIRDRTYENQQLRASSLNLLVTAIILWVLSQLGSMLGNRRECPETVGCGGHRYDRSGDVDLGVVSGPGIAAMVPRIPPINPNVCRLVKLSETEAASLPRAA